MTEDGFIRDVEKAKQGIVLVFRDYTVPDYRLIQAAHSAWIPQIPKLQRAIEQTRNQRQPWRREAKRKWK